MSKEQQELLVRTIKSKLMAKISDLAPRDSGELINNINDESYIDGNTIIIKTSKPYAAYVEFGTGKYHIAEELSSESGSPDPHKEWDIVAKNGKALAFEWTSVGGKMLGRKQRLEAKIPKSKSTMAFFAKVHHVGARPHPFIRPAIHQSDELIAESIKEVLG